MFLDALTRLASSQTAAGGGGGATTIFSDKIDLGAITPRRDPAVGEPMALVISIEEDATTTADTFDFELITDEDEAMGSPSILLKSRQFAVTELVEGFQICLPLPQGGRAYERYLGAQVTVSAGGSVLYSADIVPLSHVAHLKTYARGYDID